jgi:DcuC family C4-dicarboxylate transporter
LTIALGTLVVLGTVYLLVKQYETRMVLFGSGIALALISGDLMSPFKSFSHAMLETRLFENIIAAMGFAMVMKVTECDKHLVNLLAKWLKFAGPFLIPGTVMITFFVNISVTSAAGCAAAVGPIFIPLLMSVGIHPAIAGSAVFAGTIGAMYNPGHAQILVAASVSKSTPLDIVANHSLALLVAGLIGAFCLYIVARVLKENKGYEMPADKVLIDPSTFKVNLLWALVPLVPLVILMLGTTKMFVILKPLTISHAMIIGVLCGMIVTRTNPAKISKEFWHGAGEGFGHIFGIIICAMVFVGGLNAVGIISALTKLMTETPALAKFSAAFGPFILAVLSGSGDAAAIAFNKAVTVEAAKFGLNGMDMASTAVIAGNLGRSMSPAAGAGVICAGLAGVSPVELAKRNAPGMVLAVIATLILLMYK